VSGGAEAAAVELLVPVVDGATVALVGIDVFTISTPGLDVDELLIDVDGFGVVFPGTGVALTGAGVGFVGAGVALTGTGVGF
jgi:hypothetical protein